MSDEHCGNCGCALSEAEAEGAVWHECPPAFAPMPDAIPEPNESGTPEATELLLPIESMALTVALAQVLRKETPTENVATTCVLALARLTGRHDWTADE